MTRSGQDVVRCIGCEAYQYNAPRIETGRAIRSLSTRPNIKPSVRARIFEQFSYGCLVCGRGPPEVDPELDHIIPREAAELAGMLDDLIDSEDNLAPLCAECNSGKRAVFTVATIKLMYRALAMRQKIAEGGRDP